MSYLGLRIGNKAKVCLDRAMAKRPDTSRTAVAMGFFAANVERRLQFLFTLELPSFVYCDFDCLALVISEGYLLAGYLNA